MVTAYSPILKLALPVQGELSGTWGDVVNDNITSMVEQAIAGRAVIDTWTVDSHTLTTANGTTSESRCAMLELTDTGTALTGAGTVICPTASKIYIVKNDAGQNITVKTSAGTGILVPNGRTTFLFCDGTNVVEAMTHTTSLQLGTSTVVTAVLDEDNMASDSATSLATQQSIKAYVDAQVGANNELSEVLANGNTTGGNDILFDDNDKAIFGAGSDLEIYHDGSHSYVSDQGTGNLRLLAGNFQVNTAGNDGTYIRAGNASDVELFHGGTGGTVKLATTSTGIDVTGTAVVDGLTAPTADIDGGTIDDTVIGGTTAAAGSFTTVGATGNITSEGQVITDTINEQTATSGVTVDGVLLKDGGATFTGNATFGDNDKAIFGAGSDLQIYHDGSNSRIEDINGANLILRSSADVRIDKYTGENMGVFNADGSVDLYYDNSKKLATTSTGVDITGTLTSDGLTVDASEANILGGSSTAGATTTLIVGSGTNTADSVHGIQFRDRYGATGFPDGQIGAYIQAERSSTGADYDLVLGTTTSSTTDAVQRLRISDVGDISFYEDTGTTPKLTWDASTERLGLGTANPQGQIAVSNAASTDVIEIDTGPGFSRFMSLDRTTGDEKYLQIRAKSIGFALDSGTDSITIDSSGNVDVTGTITSDGLTVDGDVLLNGGRDLHLVGSNPNAGTPFKYGEITFGDSSSSQYSNHAKILSNGNYANQTSLEFHTSNNNSSPLRMKIDNNGDISFYEDTGTTPKFFWDASNESLGINTTSFPSLKVKLAIQGTAGASGATTNTAADEMFIDNDGDTGMTLGSSNTGTGYYAFSDSDVALRAGIFYDHSTDDMGFRVASATRMTIDSSGNLDVAGAITSDGLTVDGATPIVEVGESGSTDTNLNLRKSSSGTIGINFQRGSNPDTDFRIFMDDSENVNFDWDYGSAIAADRSITFTADGATQNLLKIDTTGDISFYENTGTTAKFFWDAAAESLGIGTDSPSNLLEVRDSIANTTSSKSTNSIFSITNENATSTAASMMVLRSNQGDAVRERAIFEAGLEGSSGGYLGFWTRPSGAAISEKMRIDSSGNVGIGTDSPEVQLETFGAAQTYNFNAGTDPLANFAIINDNVNSGTGPAIVLGSTYSSSATVANARIFAERQNTGSTNAGATDLIFEVGQASGSALAERMRINNSGNVGIGTDAPTGNLDIYSSSSDPDIRITRGTTQSRIATTSTGGLRLQADYGDTAASSFIQFSVDGNEAARFDSDGNLLVGKTSAGISNVGTTLFEDGTAYHTVDDNVTMRLNRLTDDGDIIDFRKDGDVVGSISSSGGSIIVGEGTAGLKLNGASNKIIPRGTSNQNVNGTIDLGGNGDAFKDLYLSGGVYLGGTGSANHLDDYETGTWTPVPIDANGGNEGSTSQRRGLYTKVGNLVTVTASLINIDTTGMTAGNDFRVGGLPFTAQSYTSPNMFFSGGAWGAYIGHTGTLAASITDSESTFRLTEFGDNVNTDSVLVNQITSGTADLYVNITYRTNE